MSKNIILFCALIILLAGNLFFGIKYFSARQELKEAENAKNPATNEKICEDNKTGDISGASADIVDFTRLFIRKVLKERKEVSFETQMELDGYVRALGDEAILAQWQKFLASQSEEEALEQADNLLELLVGKMKI